MHFNSHDLNNPSQPPLRMKHKAVSFFYKSTITSPFPYKGTPVSCLRNASFLSGKRQFPRKETAVSMRGNFRKPQVIDFVAHSFPLPLHKASGPYLATVNLPFSRIHAAFRLNNIKNSGIIGKTLCYIT